ncbi:MAG: ATP-binding protein [Chloroflexi bacterium CFX4]|nr:ATP-binding protein [Chloroflexi bacterium CFX4]MDL1921416.1 ATP-binding protein [Chloroflexi bacterium CFX3]
MLRLNVPRINDSPDDYAVLFDLWQQVKASQETEVVFDFATCDFFRQSGVAFIGGLMHWAKSQLKQVTITNLNNENVARNLRKNGFAEAFDLPAEPLSRTAVPYREDRHKAEESYLIYLSQSWLHPERIYLSQNLRQAILSTVIEAYINVFDHAHSPVGAFTCGQFYPTSKEIMLTLVDFGIGIPATVRKHLRQPALSAEAAIRWVFQEGNSTKARLMARGNGLKILKSFVRLNQGRLEIYSGDGYTRIDQTDEYYTTHATSFTGTVVQIALKSDESYYQLADEDDDAEELFF